MQLSNITIREGVESDLRHIQEIAFSTWPVAYSSILGKEQLDYMLDLFYDKTSLVQQMNDGHIFLMLEEDNEPIGFASFSAIDSEITKLHKLYILPHTQKKGVGKLLLNEVIERATKSGAQKLQLNVNRYNKAVKFYVKMGFRILTQADINIGHNYFMNDYVMEKKL
jgi:GNAT superfamily N-acetyltransferase